MRGQHVEGALQGELTDENATQGVVHCTAKGYVKATAGMKTDRASVDSALENGDMVHYTKPVR